MLLAFRNNFLLTSSLSRVSNFSMLGNTDQTIGNLLSFAKENHAIQKFLPDRPIRLRKIITKRIKRRKRRRKGEEGRFMCRNNSERPPKTTDIHAPEIPALTPSPLYLSFTPTQTESLSLRLHPPACDISRIPFKPSLHTSHPRDLAPRCSTPYPPLTFLAADSSDTANKLGRERSANKRKNALSAWVSARLALIKPITAIYTWENCNDTWSRTFLDFHVFLDPPASLRSRFFGVSCISGGKRDLARP